MNPSSTISKAAISPVTKPKKAVKGPEWWLMVRKFLKHGTTIASFSPSSRFLSRSILQGIDWDNVKCVVELGAGTGPITKEIVKRAKPHTKLVIVELDPDFCKVLRQKFPTADIVEGDACKLDQILAERGIEKADHVVSGLPLPSFPKELRDALIAMSAKVLGPDGEFRQLTNMPYVFHKLYKSYFSKVAFRFVPLNLPPGGVYFCRNYSRSEAQ